MDLITIIQIVYFIVLAVLLYASDYALRRFFGLKVYNTKYHLHCLRHTFAVRRYLQTRDIYLVKNELGHESVTTTEKYAKFSLRRLENDFPSLVNSTKNTQILKFGHRNLGHTSNDETISPIISGVSTS